MKENLFYKLRDHKASLDKLILSANEILDPHRKDDSELERHTPDEVVEES